MATPHKTIQRLRFVSTPCIIQLTVVLLLFTSCAQEQAAHLYLEKENQLGEGILWDAEHSTLYWIDITEGMLYAKKEDFVTSYDMHKLIGTMTPIDEERLVVALEDGIYLYNRTTREKSLLCNPPENDSTLRFNDGKADPSGRFWAGTMSLQGSTKKGALYRMEHDGTCKKILERVGISNGIVWSPCHKKMYYIDTPTRDILVFDFDKASGDISNGAILASIDQSLGYPDGMAIDSRGDLWIGMWGGGSLTHWDGQNGRLKDIIQVPAKNVTACAFGGAHLDTLFITTARIGMSSEELEALPLSGSLFYYIPKHAGSPSYRFTYQE